MITACYSLIIQTETITRTLYVQLSSQKVTYPATEVRRHIYYRVYTDSDFSTPRGGGGGGGNNLPCSNGQPGQKHN